MGNDLVNEFIVNGYKSINRIVDYFSESHSFKLLKTFASAAKIIFGKGINYICKKPQKKQKIFRINK
jgi:hypothetical protein